LQPEYSLPKPFSQVEKLKYTKIKCHD